MLPVDAAFERPTAARWLKLLSLRPPMSVTNPTLMVACGVPPPLEPALHFGTETSAERVEANRSFPQPQIDLPRDPGTAGRLEDLEFHATGNRPCRRGHQA